jgi:hypothetical protein
MTKTEKAVLKAKTKVLKALAHTEGGVHGALRV